MSSQAAMDINVLCILILVALPCALAPIADRIGRKPILISGNLALITLAYPLFSLLHHSNLTLVLLGQVGFAVLSSWIYAANPVTQAKVAPAGVRASVLSISTNLCMAIFGGTMPLGAAYLVQRTGDDFSPAYYLMALVRIANFGCSAWKGSIEAHSEAGGDFAVGFEAGRKVYVGGSSIASIDHAHENTALEKYFPAVGFGHTECR